MSRTPEVRPLLKPLRLPEANRQRLPSEAENPRERHEHECRCDECRFAVMDRRDRTGPNH